MKNLIEIAFFTDNVAEMTMFYERLFQKSKNRKSKEEKICGQDL